MDLDTNQTFQIKPQSASSTDKLRYAQWRTGSSGNEILFVYDNNIYQHKLISQDSVEQISQAGIIDEVYCGVPDWVSLGVAFKPNWEKVWKGSCFQVYEEEILGTNSAMHVSPDGKYLAYAQFDDKNVMINHTELF